MILLRNKEIMTRMIVSSYETDEKMVKALTEDGL